MNLLKNGILIGEKDIPKKLEKKEVFTMLADKIISLRKKEGWTQEEFANQLKVSRQSVSKWEGNQSIPDVDKIVQMSQIFGVSIDYLLNDDMKEPEYLETNTDFGTIRQISLEEAHEYLQAVEDSAKGVALGVVLCILSPAVLIVLLGASEQASIFSLSENIALGIGITVLLLLVALAVGIFIYSGLKVQKYEYLENEVFDTQYGVTQMVKAQQQQYQPTYTKMIILGVVLCILSAVPLLLLSLFTTNQSAIFLSVTALLVMVSCGVYLLIRTGMRWGSYLKLLQEGEYTRQIKSRKRWTDALYGSYWMLVVALFLAYSFISNDWGRSWIIFPVAGVLFGMMTLVVQMIVEKNQP